MNGIIGAIRKLRVLANPNGEGGGGHHGKTPEGKRRSVAALVASAKAGKTAWKRGHLIVPAEADPLVQEFFRLANRDSKTLAEIARGSGLSVTLFGQWRRLSSPRIVNFKAALAAFGYELRIARKRNVAEKEAA